MPPKAKFSKKEIIEAAVTIVKSEGYGALTARALGAKLGTSSSPIFTVFQSMDEVQQEVLNSANQLYQSFSKYFLCVTAVTKRRKKTRKKSNP